MLQALRTVLRAHLLRHAALVRPELVSALHFLRSYLTTLEKALLSVPELNNEASDASERRVDGASPIVETGETVETGLEAGLAGGLEEVAGLGGSSLLRTWSTECMGDTLSCGVGPDSGDTDLRVSVARERKKYARLRERWTGRSGGNLKGVSKEW